MSGPQIVAARLTVWLQEELESRETLFRDFGDPVAGFAEALEASTVSLVRTSIVQNG